MIYGDANVASLYAEGETETCELQITIGIDVCKQTN